MTNSLNYSRADWEAIRRLALILAHGMLSSGSETYRIEETAQHVLAAYGAVNIDVFAIANYLALSFENNAGEEYFAQKRVLKRSDNLDRIIKLNAYTREVCQTTPDPHEAIIKVQEIMAEEREEGFIQQVLITGFVGFSFALMLRAGIYGAIFAFFLDVLLKICIWPLEKLQVNKLFINIFGGFLITLLASTCAYFGLGSLRTVITAGSFMYLFPGLSLMNSIRDLISNDTVAGLSKLFETLLAALSIAIGSGLALTFERLYLL